MAFQPSQIPENNEYYDPYEEEEIDFKALSLDSTNVEDEFNYEDSGRNILETFTMDGSEEVYSSNDEPVYRSMPFESVVHDDLMHDAPFSKDLIQVQKVGSAETQQFHGESLNLPDHPLYSCVPVPVCVGCNNKGTQRNFEGLNPPQLPGFPFFLEPDSHMRISCHIVTIAKAIDVILSKYDPDTNFVREKCKWKGTLRYGLKDTVKYVVQLFSDSSDFIVEMQRRQGDTSLFKQVYGELTSSIREKLQTTSLTVLSTLNGADVDGELVVPALPRFPFQLEPLSHFYVNGDPHELVALVSSVLHRDASDIVDAKFIHGKCKWKISRYFRDSFVKFVVRMFADRGDYIIEVQRRQGDSWAFRQMYNDIFSATKKLPAQALPREPPSSGFPFPEKRVCLEDVDKLFISVYSPKLDVKLEAAQMILALSSKDDFRTLISESADSPYQIVKLLEEMDISEMILRSIHNLLSCEGFKAAFKDATLFTLLVDCLNSILRLSGKEYHWELSAAIVLNLPPVNSKALVDEMKPPLQSFLNLFSNSKFNPRSLGSRKSTGIFSEIQSSLVSIV